jgi:hypothetical protein
LNSPIGFAIEFDSSIDEVKALIDDDASVLIVWMFDDGATSCE